MTSRKFDHVFVLSTGRSGSTTFTRACKHFTNYTSGHETRSSLIGPERLTYPAGHIEVDNRLAWFLGRLERCYGDNAFYVHLLRNPEKVAESYDRRWDNRFGILPAYNYGIHIRQDPSEEAARDMVETITANIDAFLAEKSNKVEIDIDNPRERFASFAELIQADVVLSEALEEFETMANSSEVVSSEASTEEKQRKIPKPLSELIRSNTRLEESLKSEARQKLELGQSCDAAKEGLIELCSGYNDLVSRNHSLKNALEAEISDHRNTSELIKIRVKKIKKAKARVSRALIEEEERSESLRKKVEELKKWRLILFFPVLMVASPVILPVLAFRAAKRWRRKRGIETRNMPPFEGPGKREAESISSSPKMKPSQAKASPPFEEAKPTSSRESRSISPSWFSPEWIDIQTGCEDQNKTYEAYCAEDATFGVTPNSAFEVPENFQLLPQRLRSRVARSPVLCRAPATQYLEHFRSKKELHTLYHTLDEYFRKAVTKPNLIGSRLWENDLRVIACMDNDLRRMAGRYAHRSQEELISVIMPTMNRSNEIADAIASVVLQSYKNWELIVVDDASDFGDAKDIIDSFEDSRVRYIRLNERRGNGGARNEGIAASSGSMIAYLDDDDQWDPDNLLILLNRIKDSSARCAYGAQVVWEGFDESFQTGSSFKALRFAPFNRSLLENANYISMISFMHERSLIEDAGSFDHTLSRFLDWDFFLRITEITVPVAVPALLSHYYQGRAPASVSSSPDKSVALADIRSRMVMRSDYVRPYETSDHLKHLTYSNARNARNARQERLAKSTPEAIDILIPNFEAVDALRECLRSISGLTPTPHDVLVVDNGSRPESLEKLEKIASEYANVTLLSENESGFSHSVNRGLRKLQGRNRPVLIMNNDTLVTPDWLAELHYVLWKHPEAAVSVPRQVIPAGNKIIKAHSPSAMDDFECDINLSSHHDNVIDPFFDTEDSLIELKYAPLFCALVRPEALAKVGTLDARNGAHYRSDWVFFDEIRRVAEGRIVYTPHSKIYHMQGVSTIERASGRSSGRRNF